MQNVPAKQYGPYTRLGGATSLASAEISSAYGLQYKLHVTELNVHKVNKL